MISENGRLIDLYKLKEVELTNNHRHPENKKRIMVFSEKGNGVLIPSPLNDFLVKNYISLNKSLSHQRGPGRLVVEFMNFFRK